MLNEEELVEMYKTNMLLIKEHGFSLTEIEGMFPFERQIYILLIADYLEEKQKALGVR